MGRKFSTDPSLICHLGNVALGLWITSHLEKVISYLLLRHPPTFLGLLLLSPKRTPSAKKP
jgi:hypothetical protein